MLKILLSLILVLTAAAHAQDKKGLKRATFSMYCYWTGEATLGKIPGVKQTKIGHLDGKEIVEVMYDPKKTNPGEMAKALKNYNSFYSLLYRNDQEKDEALQSLSEGDVKSASDNAHFIAPKHSLKVKYPKIYNLDLTEDQAIKLNVWAHFGGPMPDVLTEEQKNKLK